MNTNNWRTNLGGAISVTGTGLIGIGVLSQLSQLSPKTQVLSPEQLAVMWYVALSGFVLSCVGKGVTALFAADAKALDQTKQQTQAALTDLQSQISQVKNDTTIIPKP